LTYIGKLFDEIIVERGKRMDRQLLNNALSSFEDTLTEIVRVASDIAQSQWINPQARVMALREIREAHNAVFEKLFDAGVFDGRRGSLEFTIRNTPLLEEKKKAATKGTTLEGGNHCVAAGAAESVCRFFARRRWISGQNSFSSFPKASIAIWTPQLLRLLDTLRSAAG